MLKKLRIKFIALNMATVAIVLVAVFSAICFINHQQSVNAVYAALDSSLSFTENRDRADSASSAAGARGAKWASGQTAGAQGDAQSAADQAGQADQADQASQPDQPDQADPSAANDAAASAPSDDAAARDKATPPEIGGGRDGAGTHIPVAVYLVDDDGAYSAIPTVASASIADDVLAQAIDQLEDAPDGSGELADLGLYYERRTSERGVTHIAFADVSSANGWQTLALTLAGVGVGALAVFFVISLFFSRWALRPVARAWAQQRQFVADASHELKTPLTVILANTSILMAHPERTIASQSQWVESTQAEGARMQELVADLLLLARMDAEETDIVKSKPTCRIDLSNLVESELLQFESVAFERSIALEGVADAGVFVVGNAERLRRLVTTLLDNACKYAEEGGAVEAGLHVRGGNAVFTVHNTGSFISGDDLPHVFDRFYRADKARTSGAGGYGLGLSIAREVAEEHGGTIAAESSEEAGTTFTATIPLA